MAFLEHDPTSGRLRSRFRFGGRGFKRSLKTKDRDTAEAILQRVEATLADLEVGRLRIPEGTDVGRFVVSDGKLAYVLGVPVTDLVDGVDESWWPHLLDDGGT
jgi:hypothetical protein